MKKKFSALMLISAILINQFSSAQNLVPNWSFEDTVSCPLGTGNIDKAVGWSSYRNSPDYFNSCSINQVGVPSNGFGYQVSRSGNAYAGFFTYAGGSTNAREIIGCQLAQPMIIGQKYFVIFFTTLAFKDQSFGHHLNTATNKTGVRFTTFPYSAADPVSIDNYAQIYSDSVISDTINWHQISGSFIADSAYNYISVGNFFTDSATTHISLDTLPPFFPNAYYFVDDIYVSTDSLSGIPEMKNDQLINIYPNPTYGLLNIRGTSTDPIDVQIYSLLGQCILQHTIKSDEYLFDLTHLDSGVYLIIVKLKQRIITHLIARY